jgi:hypothetical protein
MGCGSSKTAEAPKAPPPIQAVPVRSASLRTKSFKVETRRNINYDPTAGNDDEDARSSSPRGGAGAMPAPSGGRSAPPPVAIEALENRSAWPQQSQSSTVLLSASSAAPTSLEADAANIGLSQAATRNQISEATSLVDSRTIADTEIGGHPTTTTNANAMTTARGLTMAPSPTSNNDFTTTRAISVAPDGSMATTAGAAQKGGVQDTKHQHPSVTPGPGEELEGTASVVLTGAAPASPIPNRSESSEIHKSSAPKETATTTMAAASTVGGLNTAAVVSIPQTQTMIAVPTVAGAVVTSGVNAFSGVGHIVGSGIIPDDEVAAADAAADERIATPLPSASPPPPSQTPPE